MTFFFGPAQWALDRQADYERLAPCGLHADDPLAEQFEREDRAAEKHPAPVYLLRPAPSVLKEAA
jgi:hypothetical protein